MSARGRTATLLIAGALALGASAAPAAALNPVGALCGAAGAVSGGANPCGAIKHVGGVVTVGKKLATGHLGAAVGAAAGTVGSTVVSLGLSAVGAWVLGGAKFALDETAKVLGATTSPQLQSTWFSGTYWRMAGISAVLTLPFLFAAAVQALLRSDLSLLVRAALIHLPLSMLVISIAAPLTMLLLAASDELSAIVSGAAGNESAHFLQAASLAVADLSGATSPFLAFLVGAFTVVGAVVLWIELLMRETAVYVIVLMLPLAFAAFVWPARRIWAVRTLELLGALILSKFAIVAVLSLGGAALGSTLGHPSVGNWLAGLVLVLMAALMPWALLRLVPMAEVASGAAGSLRHELHREVDSVAKTAAKTAGFVAGGADWLRSMTGHMREQAEEVRAPDPGGDGLPPAAGAAGAAPPGGGGSEPAGEEGRDPDASEAQDGEAVPQEQDTNTAPPVGAPFEYEAAPAADVAPAGEELPIGYRVTPAARPAAPAVARDAAAPARDAARAAPEPGPVEAAPLPGDAAPGAADLGNAEHDVSGARAPAPWDSELLDAGPLTRQLRYGNRTLPTRIVDARRSTADEPDPLPPAPERPEGVL